MRSLILMAIVAMLTFVSAIPITPSAPRLQKRAEQFRLEGLKEFEIAERLSSATTASDLDSYSSHMKNPLFRTLLSEDENDVSGDIAPGSLEAPQILPSAPLPEESSWLQTICAFFHGSESSFGYEGKELELRRPTGMRHWKQSFGGFRR
ncbi:Nn.00g041920.m01.CDS01 [Neocucurbitaria sp. VM-36]